MMKNYIIEWVGDKLIEIPWLKKQHELNIIENDITNIILDIKLSLLQLYRYKNVSYQNRLLISIHERLDDLYELSDSNITLTFIQYYEWIVNENINIYKFIKSWGKITQQYEPLEIVLNDEQINILLNKALQLIYNSITHKQKISAYDLYNLKYLDYN